MSTAKTVGIVYLVSAVLITLATCIAFYRDRKESGVPMILALDQEVPQHETDDLRRVFAGRTCATFHRSYV